jgi:hypothetical protein
MSMRIGWLGSMRTWGGGHELRLRRESWAAFEN